MIVTARIRCRDGADAELTAAARDVIAATRTEPGCLTYVLLQDLDDPSSYFFYEEWADYDALRAHFGASHLTAFQAATRDCVASQEIRIHTVEKSRTL
jgi:quinol monooxygenase YgiN